MIKCSICGCKNLTPINSHCVFLNIPINRYKCQECDLVFGPIEFINLSKEELIEKYKKLYATYAECDSTNYEVKTFLSMKPEKNGIYLNYGGGMWSKSHKILSDMGYKVDSYDPSFTDNLTESIIYDGIFSHNVIEHLQTPIQDFHYFRSILKPTGVMVHSSPCYLYKYEYSIFHLHFLIGKSLQILADKTKFELEHLYDEPDYMIKKFLKLGE